MLWTNPTLLAPMQGVGAPPVRDLLATLGRPGLACAPFVRITSQAPNPSWLVSHVHRTLDVPLSVQLLGSHPGHLGRAARCLADAGVDVIDLNLGCPSRQVVSKGVGAALLSSVDQISRIVAAMRAACHARLSVKIRSGGDSADDVLRIAKAIEEAGADFLVVHPRLRSQGYDGIADWSIVKRVKEHLTIPVVGNGDCWYARDALRLMALTGADAVMLGRPALRNPFIFRQIDELRRGRAVFVPTGADIVAHVGRLAESFAATLLRTRRGPTGALKEHLQYLLRALPESSRHVLWDRTKLAEGLGEILEAIRPLHDMEQLDLAADGPFRFETTPVDPGPRSGVASCGERGGRRALLGYDSDQDD
jgi:tRNA-dihydrouridine synthase B